MCARENKMISPWRSWWLQTQDADYERLTSVLWLTSSSLDCTSIYGARVSVCLLVGILVPNYCIFNETTKIALHASFVLELLIETLCYMSSDGGQKLVCFFTTTGSSQPRAFVFLPWGYVYKTSREHGGTQADCHSFSMQIKCLKWHQAYMTLQYFSKRLWGKLVTLPVDNHTPIA